MFRRPSTACLLALALVLAGCSSLRVRSDFDRSIDFARYRTFRWAPTEKGEDWRRSDHSLLDARIRRAVDAELAKKGLQRRADGPADLLVVYRARSRDRVDVYRGWGHPHRWGPIYDIHQYREGTLAILLVDPALDQVVWEGLGVGIVGDSNEPEEKIAEAVRKILEDYPPR